jgi:hypothetical protein
MRIVDSGVIGTVPQPRPAGRGEANQSAKDAPSGLMTMQANQNAAIALSLNPLWPINGIKMTTPNMTAEGR